MWIGNRARSTSSFEERQEIPDHEIAGQVHDTEPTIISAKVSRNIAGPIPEVASLVLIPTGIQA
jgi:hypothetical protein